MVSCTSETPQRKATTSPILRSVIEEVTVLGDRSGEGGEVDLTVLIDGDHPDHRSCLAVAGKEHGPGTDIAGRGRFTGLGQSKPLRRMDLAISSDGHGPCFVCVTVGQQGVDEAGRIAVGQHHSSSFDLVSPGIDGAGRGLQLGVGRSRRHPLMVVTAEHHQTQGGSMSPSSDSRSAARS